METVNIGSLIERDPKIRGGRPCVADTGVSVQRIVGWYALGLSPEEIAVRFGHLSLAQIHAALTYYHANRQEMDAEIALDAEEGDRLEKEFLASRRACGRQANPHLDDTPLF